VTRQTGQAKEAMRRAVGSGLTFIAPRILGPEVSGALAETLYPYQSIGHRDKGADRPGRDMGACRRPEHQRQAARAAAGCGRTRNATVPVQGPDPKVPTPSRSARWTM